MKWGKQNKQAGCSKWQQSLENRLRTARIHGVDVSTICYANLIRSRPVRYLKTVRRPGCIEDPSPDTIMVFIALDRLSYSNGLPWAHYHQILVLEQGQDLTLNGDDTQLFSGQGGGMAYLLVFKRVPGRIVSSPAPVPAPAPKPRRHFLKAASSPKS